MQLNKNSSEELLPAKLVSEQHRSFLNKRGITDKVIDAFSISSGDIDFLHLKNAIIIPVRHIDGTFSFNKYRRDPMEGPVKPKYLYDRGGKVTLYGADKLVAQYGANAVGDKYDAMRNYVVITEGELDTLVCWSQNIPAVSSTGGAQSFQEEWVELLKGYSVYVCFDNDEAGHKGAIKVLENFASAGIDPSRTPRVMFVPTNIPGVKDISDYVAHGGDLHALMQTAKQYLSIEDVEVERQRIAAQWGDYTFHTLYIDHHKTPTLPSNANGAARPTSQSDDRLKRAKSVDCTTLIEFNRRGRRYPVAKCRWHDDHDPSLTYYARNNTTYCHVCSKYADAVDIVMERDGVTFKEALKILLKEV